MRQYHRLLRVAQKYYPQEGGFCTVIATAIACQVSFGKARSALYKVARRVNRKGTTVSNHLLTIQSLGYKATRFEGYKAKSLITIQRELANTTGTYFVYTKQHVTTIQDGITEDWCNNEEGRVTRYNIESIYKIERDL